MTIKAFLDSRRRRLKPVAVPLLFFIYYSYIDRQPRLINIQQGKVLF